MDSSDIHPAQIRAARALLNMTQDELAKKAGVTRKTLARLENGEAASRDSTTVAALAVLEDAGVRFFTENGRHGVSFQR